MPVCSIFADCPTAPCGSDGTVWSCVAVPAAFRPFGVCGAADVPDAADPCAAPNVGLPAAGAPAGSVVVESAPAPPGRALCVPPAMT